MKKGGWRETDAQANDALTRFHDRTQWNPVYGRTPLHEIMETEEALSFHDFLAREDDGISGGDQEGAGEYEINQRIVGIMAFFRFLKARGVHPAMMLKQLAAAGRACHIEPFNLMTMEEIGLMFGETKAAHSWRCKLLSKEIELAGMRGSKLPGQKRKKASESYRQVRLAKANGHNGNGERKPVQKSFLRKLHVMPKK